MNIIKVFLLGLFILTSTACFDPRPDLPLKNTYWGLVSLQGEDVIHFDHRPEIHLVFHINDKSLHGSDGCNTLRAKYQKDGDKLSFSHINLSRISCDKEALQAQSFKQVLQATDTLRISEEQMFLYKEGKQIASFEAKEEF